jgi:outer membrane protein assembly factor BamB
MTQQQKTALWLTLILAAFSCAVVLTLVRDYQRENRDGVLVLANQLELLKNELALTPKDEALIEEIRTVDRDLRMAHFAARRRFKLGAWLLAAMLIGCVASARRWMALGVPVEPAVPEGGTTREQPRAGALSAGIVTAIGFVALGYAALTGRPELPQPGWAPPPPPEAPEVIAEDPVALEELRKNWPGFRGPDGIGLAADGDWPTSWSVAQNHNILWQTPLPVEGKSSPAVWEGRVFVTGGNEAEQRVVCLNAETGEILWNVPLDANSRAEELDIFEDTGFAAPTPVVDGRRVYALFATGILAAYDFDGNHVWTTDLGAPDSIYGFASSPLLVEGLLIVQFDQGMDADAEKSELIALDPATGEIRWATPRPVINSWTSPALARTPDRLELITHSSPWVIAYDPLTGVELWRAGEMDGDIAASPAVGAGLVFVANDSAQVMAIRPGGEGDVTESHIVWTEYEGLPDAASPLCDGQWLLLAGPGGQLVLYEAKEGAILWERFLTSNVTASLILAGGRAYVAGEDGITRILELGETYRERGRGEVGEPVYATPAFADSRIYIRSETSLICVGQKP